VLDSATTQASNDAVVREILDGLRRRPKQLPCKYFYDQHGSELFERICRLEEYYPTRTELSILAAEADDIATTIGPNARIIELGSGAGIKTRRLLAAVHRPVDYVPIEIDASVLARATETLQSAFPQLAIHPLAADYTRPIQLPVRPAAVRKSVIFFPGSTIGNFEPPEAEAFLSRLSKLNDPPLGLLIGIDLIKPVEILERAYNDAQGLTAAFNKNLLAHLRRLLETPELDPEAFRHVAFYNQTAHRIEMHLEAEAELHVEIGGEAIPISAGERIQTESSYKYTIDGFAKLARRSGFRRRHAWTDARQWFGVLFFERALE